MILKYEDYKNVFKAKMIIWERIELIKFLCILKMIKIMYTWRIRWIKSVNIFT